MILRSSAIGVLALAALVGCSQKSEPSSNIGSLNAASIVADKSLSAPTKAQRLADTSEQLLSVQGFDYANDVADLALAQDPANVKAQFLKALLGPIIVQRGIAARVAPLAALDAKAQDGYSDALAKIDEQPDSTVKAFILDGQPDIKTESDIQAHLDAVADSFGKIRDFAKQNKNSEIVMNGTDEMYRALLDRQRGLCTVEQVGSYAYKYVCPSDVKMLQTTIDRGDLEVVQQYAAGMELYLSLYNSYDLTGAIKLAQETAAKRAQVVSPQAILDQLLANLKFGTIRNGNGFAKIKAMGADAITGLRWVMANQAKLCPMGVSDQHNRVGALVNNGICVPSSEQAKLNSGIRKVESALQGGQVTVPVMSASGPSTTSIIPSALLDHPIADLHSLTPVSYNTCGEIVGLADPSIGGLFPNKDANSVMKQGSKCP